MGRLTARLRRRDERGFTLLEVMIAISIIFASLLALAYTATIGFTYESLARQKQTATGIADQVMEEVRGLAWEKITQGLSSSDLTGDPRLVTGCSGDPAGTYRFLSCTPDTSVPGQAEKVVADAPACTAPDCPVPLIPHTGTITQNSIDYSWATYVTNDCKTATDDGCTEATPYRVTVIVTWTGGRTAPNKIVQSQSLFWSPVGCRSTATHPFAAPCQPFFYGLASVPQGSINISGTISGDLFSSADLFTSALQSTAQQEQLSQAQGNFTQSSVRIVDTVGTTQTAGGGTDASSAADTDPGTTSSVYSQVTCPSVTVPCTGGTVSTGASSYMAVTAPSGETAESDSATAAGGSAVCPPAPDTAETDQKPCSGGKIQMGGTLSAVAHLHGFAENLGDATIASVAAPASPSKTFVNRVAYPTTGTLCTPTASSTDYGCIESKATRVLGALQIGGLPQQIDDPAGWNGAYFSLSSYQTQVTATAGVNPSLPTAAVSSGTISCWNGSNGYTSVGATSGGVAGACQPLTYSDTVDGHQVDVSIQAQSASPASTSINPTSLTNPLTDVTAQVNSPTATILYSVSLDGVTVVNLTITLNLGTTQAHSVYAPPPSPS
ncbi:MAG: prepilin-type N-terminal cleavage/methylation domain-containing protein [Candidatus Velamenicoccus archaeovorus]